MALRYIAIEVELPKSIEQYSLVIEAAIAQYGSPIRWAITTIGSNHCKVEAVVRVEPTIDSTHESN